MTVSIIISAYLVPGVSVTWWAAIWVAVLLGLANITLKPILIVLTLPINILTLGLFTLVINGFLIWLLGTIIEGFVVTSFWWAIVFSVVLSVISYLLNIIFE